jgi:hypothetical protein
LGRRFSKKNEKIPFFIETSSHSESHHRDSGLQCRHIKQSSWICLCVSESSARDKENSLRSALKPPLRVVFIEFLLI